MKLKRPLLIAGVLLSVAGAGFTYWRIGSTPKEPPFLTVPVSKGNVRQVVSSTGTLQAVGEIVLAMYRPALGVKLESWRASRRRQGLPPDGRRLVRDHQARFALTARACAVPSYSAVPAYFARSG